MPEAPTSSLTQAPPLPQADDTVYFNGFGIALSSGDVMVTLVRNGIPVLTMNGSYTVMKSLGAGLSKAVSELETMMATKIMTVDEISKVMASKGGAVK